MIPVRTDLLSYPSYLKIVIYGTGRTAARSERGQLINFCEPDYFVNSVPVQWS